MVYMLLFILSLLAAVAGLWKIFEKAGYKGWQALIPLFNFYIWLKVIDKPLWWFIFILLPFINVFTVLLMVVETLKCFRKDGLGEQALGVLLPFVYLPWLGFSKKQEYTHPSKLPVIKKSAAREWADAIIFAVIAASVIRAFMLEAYTIPTSSMESSLLVGDYLFVSKLSYGPRVPHTPIAFPFTHHTLPLTDNAKAYLTWIQLPHYRFPGIRSIGNNDVVVFNHPADPIDRPVDKRENYIKRCLAIPGDTFELRDARVYINNARLPDPPDAQHFYRVKSDDPLSAGRLERLGITDWGEKQPGVYLMAMTADRAESLETVRGITDVDKRISQKSAGDRHIFPHHRAYPWNQDNMGPLYVPEKGATVEINMHNIPLYERIISVYEGHDLRIEDDAIYINDEMATSYTFEMDYYWMVGDYRHNSEDSRYWGFVPEDHIVGRAMFVWLSLSPTKGFPANIRFDKSLRTIR